MGIVTEHRRLVAALLVGAAGAITLIAALVNMPPNDVTRRDDGATAGVFFFGAVLAVAGIALLQWWADDRERVVRVVAYVVGGVCFIAVAVVMSIAIATLTAAPCACG